MDAIELLAREDEFKRLNKQLEKKTESLMKEIEDVMQKQDFFSEFSPSFMTPRNKKYHTPSPQIQTPVKRNIKKKNVLESPKSLESDSDIEKPQGNVKNRSKLKEKQGIVLCNCCTHVNRSDEMDFLYAFVNVNVKDKVLPPSFSKEDRVTVESVCKFLSSKIKLMQEQIDKLQNTIEKKASQCESHLTQLAELESERMHLLNTTNNMKSGSADMRAKYMALQKRYDEKEKEYKVQRSETDKLTADLKRLRTKNSNIEAKCASQEQVIENLRQQLDLSKRADKELRDASRQQSSSYDSAISRLEAQNAARAAKTDKQMALIHNLRKQIALLATDGAVNALSVEYSEFLNQFE